MGWVRLSGSTRSHRPRRGIIYGIDEALHGAGIGYVDAQLLAAGRLTPEASLWTGDRRLSRLAARLGLAFQP